jgi:hypothetical protein
MTRYLLLLLAACHPAPLDPPAARPQAPDPRVDMACVQRVRDGKPFAGLPAELSGFHATVRDRGVHLHRDGRKLDDAGGKQLWEAFNTKVFGGDGGVIASATLGMYSVYSCSDADKPSCVKASVWVCQSSIDLFATRITDALAGAGLGDAELTVDVTAAEPPGPACKQGAACLPAPHYSVKDKKYDPDAPRISRHDGSGRCENDGDCEGANRNHCDAWYLGGGAEEDLFIQYHRPTFCGCIEEHCTWFQQ